jgi:hypothetical protein
VMFHRLTKSVQAAWMRADKLADYITSVILKLQCMALCIVMTGMYKRPNAYKVR